MRRDPSERVSVNDLLSMPYCQNESVTQVKVLDLSI